MKNRIFKNPKSSILGLLLLGFACFAVMTGKASLSELIAFAPFCLGLIYVKDSVFKPKS
ncbi:MAG: hypothetical protein GX587_15195 [Bacteroidales bacterium]|nr:hypothetical protein [Bacteroidales bacterium]